MVDATVEQESDEDAASGNHEKDNVVDRRRWIFADNRGQQADHREMHHCHQRTSVVPTIATCWGQTCDLSPHFSNAH